MSIAYFIPPTIPPNERARGQAVHDSGLIEAAATVDLERLLAQAIRATGTKRAAVTAIFDDRAQVLAAIGFPVGIMRRSSSFSGHAILQDDAIFVVPDAEADERFAGNPVVSEEQVLRFFAGAVMRTQRGLALGTLSVFDPEPRAGLAEQERQTLIALADQVMSALIAHQYPPALDAALG